METPRVGNPINASCARHVHDNSVNTTGLAGCSAQELIGCDIDYGSYYTRKNIMCSPLHLRWIPLPVPLSGTEREKIAQLPNHLVLELDTLLREIFLRTGVIRELLYKMVDPILLIGDIENPTLYMGCLDFLPVFHKQLGGTVD